MSGISGIGSSMMSSMMSMNSMRGAGRQGPSPEEMFKKVDSDSSGGIDATELQTFADKMAERTGNSIDVEEAMKTYDADGDGALSQEEMDTMMKETMASMGGPPMGGPGPMGGPPPSPEDIFDDLDSDSSGAIDATELQTFADQVSDRTGNSINVEEVMSTYDADGDGALSQDEMETMLDEMKDTIGGGRPPVPPQRAMDAYGAAGMTGTGSVNDMFASLLQMLGNGSDDTSTAYLPLNLTV